MYNQNVLEGCLIKEALMVRLIILKNSNNSTQLPKLMYFLFFPQNQKHMSKISLYSRHLDENENQYY